LYRLWVVGGILAIVVVNVVRGLSADPGDETVLTTALAMVGVWVLGFLGLSWWRLLADRRAAAPALPAVSDGPPGDVPGLLQALAVEPLDARQAQRTADASWAFARNGFAALTLLVAAILVAMGLHATERLGAEAALLPLLALVAVLALRVPFQARRAMEIGDAWLEPLHLRITGMPAAGLDPGDGEGLRVMGATRLGGVRHGRVVSVALAADGSLVTVAGAVEPFRAVSDAERLAPAGGAPSWLAGTLPRAGRDPRWRRVEVTGGPDGIAVRRRGTPDGMAWLADLWLAERLAAAAPTAYAA
jgi:hypothetical protein